MKTVRDLRRNQIVAAARELVAEGGLDALTFGSLEKRLGFTRGVITYHFEDKEEIVNAVLDSVVEEIDQATVARIEASLGFEDRLRAMLTGAVRGFVEHREAGYIIVSFWSRVPFDGRVAGINARLYSKYRKYAAKLIREHAPGENIDAFAAMLVSLVIGTVIQAYFEPRSIDPNAVIEEATRSVVARFARLERLNAGAASRRGGDRTSRSGSRRASRGSGRSRRS